MVISSRRRLNNRWEVDAWKAGIWQGVSGNLNFWANRMIRNARGLKTSAITERASSARARGGSGNACSFLQGVSRFIPLPRPSYIAKPFWRDCTQSDASPPTVAFFNYSNKNQTRKSGTPESCKIQRLAGNSPARCTRSRNVTHGREGPVLLPGESARKCQTRRDLSPMTTCPEQSQIICGVDSPGEFSI
jgi:hypothetical protein